MAYLTFPSRNLCSDRIHFLRFGAPPVLGSLYSTNADYHVHFQCLYDTDSALFIFCFNCFPFIHRCLFRSFHLGSESLPRHGNSATGRSLLRSLLLSPQNNIHEFDIHVGKGPGMHTMRFFLPRPSTSFQRVAYTVHLLS